MAALPKPSAFGFGAHHAASLGAGQPGIWPRIFHDAVVAEGFLHGGHIGQCAVCGRITGRIGMPYCLQNSKSR